MTDSEEVTLTVRMIMNGKEVGSIIGKGGEIINNIRESSGAKIHITDGSVPERVITVSGFINAIIKAYGMICRKLEEDGSSSGRDSQSSSSSRSPVCIKLIIPACQCGSLIGKGGSKIKEIREISEASVQVASEMLPNSTERTVTISGNSDTVSKCIHQICLVMLDFPPKGSTIPYLPKLGAAGILRGRGSSSVDNPLAGLLGLGSGGASSALAAIASLAGSQLRSGSGGRRDRDRDNHSHSHSYEMKIPNELIGCIIGKGGSKIAEIRQFSGAMIRISKSDEGGSHDEHSERHITISGSAEAVAVAKSLINMSLDMHKSKLDEREREGREGNGGSTGSSSRDRAGGRYTNPNLGLAQLLQGKPDALTTALTTLATLNGLSGLSSSLSLFEGAGSSHNHSHGMHVTGVHRSRGGFGSSRGNRDDDRRETKRSKFAPY